MVNLTNSQEEYLKTIYILKNTQKDIRVTDIAKKLDKSKASVNNAINLLKNDETYITVDELKQILYGEL